MSTIIGSLAAKKALNKLAKDAKTKDTTKKDPAKKEPPTQSFEQKEKTGLLVTAELEHAIERCKAKVEQIVAECRRNNRKFRDLEFDLESDRDRCLHGLTDDDQFHPSDVRRVPQIFDKPAFFLDGADSSDIVQGALGDCWFLSALATVGTMPGLIEKFCVARDEQVGVYGFIFFKNASWVDVVIDDLLYTRIPKWEELSPQEVAIYHDDKDRYNHVARKGGRSLYFAKSGQENETWVPLIEKAFAKLHGDYASLSGGEACEAIEDMTGGVCSFIHTKDILDPDRFWNEELTQVTKGRLFGCAMGGFATSDKGSVNGLLSNHAYSVLSAIEYNGKRFVRVRNPWGQTEWDGRWSDGSKEWTQEWLAALPVLGHTFGDDGAFIMEYTDFLDVWQTIDRTLLFDSSWALSSHWLKVTAQSFPCAWNFGDVSFTVSIPSKTNAVLALQQLDDRYFRDLSNRFTWSFDFVLFKKGSNKPVAHSQPQGYMWDRSCIMQIELEEGEYVVHVRLDRRERSGRSDTYFSEGFENWDKRKLSKVWAEKNLSSSIAANFDPKQHIGMMPLPVEAFGGQDLTDLELQRQLETEKAREAAKAAITPSNELMTAILPDSAETPEEPPVEQSVAKAGKSKKNQQHKRKVQSKAARATEQEVENEEVVEDDGGEDWEDEDEGEDGSTAEGDEAQKNGDGNEDEDHDGEGSEDEDDGIPVHEGIYCDGCHEADPNNKSWIRGPRYKCLDSACPNADFCQKCVDAGVHPSNHSLLRINVPEDAAHLDGEDVDEQDCVTLGLKVYTHKDSPATIRGQLRHGKAMTWKRPETK